MLNTEQLEAAALALRTAEETRQVIGPLTDTYPGIDVVDAYEIQLVNIRKRVAEGALVRGHKVGLSAKAMQQMLGVHEPDYGHLLDDMFVDEGSSPATAACLAKGMVADGTDAELVYARLGVQKPSYVTLRKKLAVDCP